MRVCRRLPHESTAQSTDMYRVIHHKIFPEFASSRHGRWDTLCARALAQGRSATSSPNSLSLSRALEKRCAALKIQGEVTGTWRQVWTRTNMGHFCPCTWAIRILRKCGPGEPTHSHALAPLVRSSKKIAVLLGEIHAARLAQVAKTESHWSVTVTGSSTARPHKNPGRPS